MAGGTPAATRQAAAEPEAVGARPPGEAPLSLLSGHWLPPPLWLPSFVRGRPKRSGSNMPSASGGSSSLVPLRIGRRSSAPQSPPPLRRRSHPQRRPRLRPQRQPSRRPRRRNTWWRTRPQRGPESKPRTRVLLQRRRRRLQAGRWRPWCTWKDGTRPPPTRLVPPAPPPLPLPQLPSVGRPPTLSLPTVLSVGRSSSAARVAEPPFRQRPVSVPASPLFRQNGVRNSVNNGGERCTNQGVAY